MQQQESRRSTIVLLTLLASLSMLGPFNIDTPFPAFTRIGADFGATTEQLQLIVTAYLLAFAVMSPFHGPLSDALGRKPVILVSLGAYLLATIGCALATSLEMLLVFRVLQGLATGGGVIVSRTVIRDSFDGVRAQVLMSWMTMIFGLAPALAPIIGGWLLFTGTWRSIFWFLVVLAGVLLVAVAFALRESHPPDRRTPFSVVGILASLVEVSRDGRFQRVAWAAALSFAGQFLYIGAAPIFVVHLLGLGEQDFWVFFVPMIGGVTIGAWLSSKAAGRITRERLISYALAFGLAGALLNVVLAATIGASPVFSVVGPAMVAAGTGAAYPSQQLVLLDLFPASRGASVSMFTFMTLTINGLGAALIAPRVTASVLTLALAALGFVALGFLFWVLHLARRDSLSRQVSGP